MSQDTFPFAEGEEHAAGFAEDGEPNRKRLLIAGAAAAALVLGLGAWFVLGGSGGSSATDTAFVPSVPRAAAPSAKKPAALSLRKLPAPYKAQLGRDPFRALYVIPAAVASPAPAAGTPATGTTGSTGSVTPTGTGTTPVTPVNQEYKLVLKRVYGTGQDRTAVFGIDNTSQVAKIGSKFGPTGEIVLLSLQQGPKAGQWTAVLQVGDGDPFDVVTGTAAFVR